MANAVATRTGALLGREHELSVLDRALEQARPRIVFVSGIAGIGKSALVAAFGARARDRGATVVSLDCRDVEPTQAGFLGALAAATGSSVDLPGVTARLAELGARVVLALDTYEVYRLLDPWLRRAVFDALPPNTIVLIAGREEPSAAWHAAEDFLAVALGPLPRAAAEAVLVRAGMAAEEATRVNRLIGGYPLGLAVATTTERLDLPVAEAAVQVVVQELTRTYLADLDPLTRSVLDAASVVRRVTVPLLGAMFPDVAPQDAFERLRRLPFVEVRHDGLAVHEAIQQAVSSLLSASDPDSKRRYQRAAWRRLRTELRGALPQDLWRCTADMLYLIENPVVREAFFPTASPTVVVQPAGEADGEAILEIADLHETPEGAELVRAWWRQAPDRFVAARDGHGAVVGLSCILTPPAVTQRLVTQDPVMAWWWEHLRENPVPKSQTVLFIRWGLSREAGEGPSAVQAALWLEIKRMYMELRPHLRRVYSMLWDLETYLPTLTELGFAALPGGIPVGGVANRAVVLDLGPASIDGWLTWLAASELGVDEETILDVEQREIVLDGRRVPLTKLEFGLLKFLSERAGKPASRRDLLEAVWGYDNEIGSNVVDALVRSVRKKLGDRAPMIETVRGAGYRLREPR